MEEFNTPNINYLWTSLLVEEIIRNGCEYFCIAPGSRSAPLAFAAAQNPRARSFVHFDERGLAFYALGLAAATRRPAVIITTSGTAVANLFPAVIEASKKKLSLIILTADRPPELRLTGAHQTIDQTKIFGEYIRWQMDMPCPTKEIPAEFVLTTVDQAVFRSQGELPGPVHLNCMFREPLAPIKTREKFTNYLNPLKAWIKSDTPYTRYEKAGFQIGTKDLEEAVSVIEDVKNGILVVGKLSGREDELSVLKLAEKLNWPLLPDVSSGLRLGCRHKNVISYFDQILLNPNHLNKYKIGGVLHLGGRITSKRWYEFVEGIRPAAYISVLNHPLRNDPLHGVTHRVQAPIGEFCQALVKKVSSRRPSASLRTLQKANQDIDRRLEKFVQDSGRLTELAVARLISQNIPEGTSLFLGNSLPIREVDMFADPKGNAVEVGGNRGASGIDGVIASAAGFAQGLKKPTTLLIGDLSALHDLNSLAMLKNLAYPLVIVILNNDGGGVFNFLPIAKFRETFERCFAAPHHLTFGQIAEAFSLPHTCPSSVKEFVRAYQSALQSRRPSMIEVKTKREENVNLQKQLQLAIKK